MTFRQATAFIAKWRPLLAPEWTVTVIRGQHPGESVNDSLAAVEPENDYLRARLYVGQVVDGDLDAHDQRRVLLHELIHMTLRDLQLAAHEAARGLGYEAHKLADETINRYLERSIDRLADTLADL
jgi:hypothetical protein